MSIRTASDQGKPLRALIVNRESKGDEDSIDDQDRINNSALEEHGWTHAGTLEDRVGASRFSAKQRTAWPKVYDWVAGRKCDVLVVGEISRADRVMDTWVPFITACADHDVLIYTSYEGGKLYDPRDQDDREVLIDKGKQSEAETARLSRRSRKGTNGAALRGKQHGKCAYGFTRVYDSQNRKKFRDVPNENAPIVVEIITRVSKEEPLRKIAIDLTARGIPAPKGGAWRPESVRYIARNKIYIQVRVHNSTKFVRASGKRVVTKTAEFEAKLVDPVCNAPDWEATFWRAQSVLGDPSRRKSQPATGHTQERPGARRWLLSDIAAPAGCAVNGRFVMKANTATTRERRYQCRHDTCMSINAEDLDNYVTERILARLADPAVREVFLRGDAALAGILADIDQLKTELRQAREACSQDRLSLEALIMIEGRKKPQLAQLEARVKEASESSSVLDLLGDGTFTAKTGWQRWRELSMQARRTVIRALCESIVVDKSAQRLTRYATPERRMAFARDRTTITWRE